MLLKIEREQEVKNSVIGCVDLSVTQLMDKYIVQGDVRTHIQRTRTCR